MLLFASYFQCFFDNLTIIILKYTNVSNVFIVLLSYYGRFDFVCYFYR